MHCTFVRVLQSGSAYVPLDPTQPALRKAKILRRLSCCLGCVVIEAALWLDERERWLRSECARLGVSVVLLGEDGSVTSEEPATAASTKPSGSSSLLLHVREFVCSPLAHAHELTNAVTGGLQSCSCFGNAGELELAYTMFTSGTTGRTACWCWTAAMLTG
jgi:non-ribosomal peptide synthetase component F